MFKNKKGITLIALVITIIVLLILAGVALNAIAGENGILDKAKQAREQSEASKDLEEMQLSLGGAYIDRWVGDNSDYSDILEEFYNNGITLKGLIKYESDLTLGKDTDYLIIEYEGKLYSTNYTYGSQPADAAIEMINNMQLIDSSELKEEYEVYLGMVYYDFWDEIEQSICIEENETTYKEIIIYKNKTYMSCSILNTNTNIKTNFLEKTESDILGTPELASISTGHYCKFGLDKNGHVWNLISNEYGMNLNKANNLEDVVFTKISAGYENVLMLDSSR